MALRCSGGVTRDTPISNGHPGIWPGRASLVQSSPNVTIGPEGQVRLVPSTPTDVFQNRAGAGGMRVGRDYQARIPVCIVHNKEKLIYQEPDRALLVWYPTERIADADINGYLKVADEKFNYSREQALGLLYWHGYDIPRALEDLGNFSPHPEEWTIEDKTLFEQAFQFHGKAFDRIHKMLPDKSMSSLIRYYYKWKKTRNKTSAMDRHSKRLSQMDTEESLSNTTSVQNPSSSNNRNGNSGNYSLNVISQRQPAAHLSDSDDDITKKQNGVSEECCGNCGVPCSKLHTDDNLCYTCYIYWKRTGDYRPLTGPLRRGDKQLLGLFRQKRPPPLGMYTNHDDLTILASAAPQAENIIIQGIEKDILDAKYLIQIEKQRVEVLTGKIPNDDQIANMKPRKKQVLPSPSRITAKWTHDELLLAAQGIRLYGKDFSKIVQVIPTKSEVHIRSFYVNYCRRFELDDLIKEQELDELSQEMDTN